ncbi:hypothetical protein FRC04_012197 [Tulasnella sp. 424]|nr:hypothetical protein FRC04_012197 [Tulasnella sp. 424]
MKADKYDSEKENDILSRNGCRPVQRGELELGSQDPGSYDYPQIAARSESELKRTTRQLIQAREAAENHTSENGRVSAAFEEFKTKHETDVAQMRKQAAALNREKSDLQASLDTMKTEMVKRERMIGKNRFGSPLANNNPPAEVPTPGNYHNDEDLFASALASRRKLDPWLSHSEGEGAEAAVQEALAKEGLLNASVPGAWEDDDADDQDDVEKSPPRAAPFARGRHRPARGRGPKILTPAQKLGLASVERHSA